MKQRCFMLFYFFVLIILIPGIVKAKYVFEQELKIATIQIDQTKPKIEVIEIENNNQSYPNYANKTHTIQLKIKLVEDNIKQEDLRKEKIEIEVGGKKVIPKNWKIDKEKEEKVYQIELKEIPGEGELKVIFQKGIIVDQGNLTNDKQVISTGIILDNTPPKVEFQQIKITDGKIKAILIANEAIQKKEGWELKNNTLEKIFMNNLCYTTQVLDYAQNTTDIKILIEDATFIKINYCSHNSQVGWSYGYGNYDIAGKEAVLENPKYKTEALAFHVEGNLPKDFLQVQSYVYTYWGEGTQGICEDTKLNYSYGYNPSKNSWKSMLSKDLVTFNKKQFFQFGGSGINGYQATDSQGKNPIPTEISLKYPYGVSAIRIKLKDDSDYTVIYQILVEEVGWLNPCSNGEEACYKKDKPMSAFRMALIPKTEKNDLLQQWKKVVGTKKID